MRGGAPGGLPGGPRPARATSPAAHGGPRAPSGAEEVVWDLSRVYDSPEDPRLHADVDGAIAAAAGFRERYHGRLPELTAPDLAEAVEQLEGMEAALYRAGAYAYLRFSEDTTDPARGAFLQKLQEKGTELSTALLFFDLEWAALDDDAAAAAMQDPALSGYRHHLASIRRFRAHLLGEAEERVLSEKSLSGAPAWTRFFTEVVSGIKPVVAGGESSLDEALAALQHPDRSVRREAAGAVTSALEEKKRVTGFVFNVILLDRSIDDRLRRYPHWLASRNLENEASDASVQALIDAVVARYDIPQRYYRLKAKMLGLERIADYDRMAPVGGDGAAHSWEDAARLVLGAYEDFSGRAGGIVRRFFDERRIHAAPGPGKQPGAFCVTTLPGADPYVFLNYTADRRSVLTLAHELGHGLHGTLARDRGFFNSQTPLTTAETASVFGEALVFKKMLESESDPHRRLDLLASRIEDAIATVFRQIAMNRFEDAIHTARRSEGELSTERLGEIWIRTQSEMLGDSVELTDGYRSWWSYIPHFIGSPGYVYAYAFGYLFSLAIFQRWELEREAVVDPYLELLSAGGSDTPENLAAGVGMDLGDTGFWAAGLEAVDGILKGAEEAAGELDLKPAEGR